jgi:hypothetical protein
MTPAIQAEKELHAKILASLGEGKTYKAVAQQIGEDTILVRDVLYALDRYRRLVYIKDWELQANGIYLGLYVVGDQTNAMRPRSKYSCCDPEDVYPVILQNLPGSRGDIAEAIGVGLNRITTLISSLLKMGEIEAYKSKVSSHKIIYILPGTMHLMEKEVGRISNAKPKVQETKRAVPGSIFPELPWKGYNKHPIGTLYPSTWRHGNVPMVETPN